ncbi:hypothetical protein [Actinoplanes aureus]|uniref:Uncharacterized protein n=1 Tax=Actinoplanes aureus TaxID=2792083 RepID=A0A931CE75_9ACTN|nr:hypothetical protein [Actinoplanes aureus]MBG0568265.1 hypothetical protein [Actinoplanes aureus]
MTTLAQPIYLLLAGLCLLMAVRSLKEALAPVGVIIRAAAALALFALAVSTALVLLVATLVTG